MSSVLPSALDVDQIEFTRRNMIAQRLALVFAGIIGLYLVLIAQIGRIDSSVIFTQLLMVIFFALLSWAIARRQARYAPELLVTAVMVDGLIGSLNSGGVVGFGPTVFFVALTLASVLVRWRSNLVFGVLAVASIGLLAVLSQPGMPLQPVGAAALRTSGMINNYALAYAMLLSAVCIISCISARSHERALRQMADQSAAVAAQNEQLAAQSALVLQQSAELEQHRTRLEQEVAHRTAELSEALAELQQSAVVLRELQNPLVPIADGVLVMPLVGAFDNARSAQFIQSLLQGIQIRRAHTVLLDLTGLPVLDTLAAQTMIQASRAAKLLGATIRLVGVTPAVAQTIVGLGLDLGTLRFERDLQSAVASVLD